MTEEICKLIKMYETEKSFVHIDVTDDMIREAETRLGVTIPLQYQEYLKQFGHGGIDGMEIMGFGYTGEAIFVTETLEYRPYGLPQNYIVVENVDEWLMCIDSETGRIVSWDMSGYVQEDYESFDAYLLDQLENAIDNL